MLLNQGVSDLTVGSQGTDSSYLIHAHETAVAGDIGAEDGCEFAFYAT
jgi:hypothetical protein